jgi:pimeloyl-ACP methyl ester carboxylesterase
MPDTVERNGWLLVHEEPAAVDHRVLLLPGLLFTDLIYADMMADPAMAEANVHMIAGNPPGFKGQPAPPKFGYSVEEYAEMVEQCAASEKIDLIVGHSFFGNVCIDVAHRANFKGKLILISPSLFRMAEQSDMRTLDSASRIPVLSGITWWVTFMMLKGIFKPYFTEERQDRLDAAVADAKRTPRSVCRLLLMSLFNHINKHTDLTSRITSTTTPVYYVRGEHDNIGFTDQQRAALDACELTVVKDIEGSKHFAMMDKPKEVNQLILELLRT